MNFIGVGGLLHWNNSFLLVRHTYGEYKGKWILPGGHVNDGEHIDDAIVREFKEETNLTVRPQGIIAVRSRIRDESCTDCYVVFALEYIEGELKSDGVENDAARFFTLDEVLKLEPVVPLSKILIQSYAQKKLSILHRSQQIPYTLDNPELKLYLADKEDL